MTEPENVDRLAALSGNLTTRAKQILSLYTIGNLVYSGGRKILQKKRDLSTYTITIYGDDNIYDDLHSWLLQRLPEGSKRRLTAKTHRVREGGEYDAIPDGGASYGSRYLSLIHAGTRVETVDIGGYPIQVWIERESFGGKDIERVSEFGKKFEKLIFSANSTAGRAAVFDLFTELSMKQSKSGQRFYLANRWGDFQDRSELSERTPESVILNDGITEYLTEDLEKFLASEQAYLNLGIPWHRGYLFHGPAGTGKTSFAKVLAGHFKLDLYYIPLSDVKQDTDLINTISRVPAKSILLLEDIDIVHAAGNRDDSESQGISAAGLLNSLDGISTPHGLITIMTTNNIDVLDPALIRAGRADIIQEFGLIDPDKVNQFAKQFIGDAKPLPLLLEPAVPAEIVGILKANIHSEDKGHKALSNWIKERNEKVYVEEEE